MGLNNHWCLLQEKLNWRQRKKRQTIPCPMLTGVLCAEICPRNTRVFLMGSRFLEVF